MEGDGTTVAHCPPNGGIGAATEGKATTAGKTTSISASFAKLAAIPLLTVHGVSFLFRQMAKGTQLLSPVLWVVG